MNKANSIPVCFEASNANTQSAEACALDGLPEWNLADLYPGIDSPQVNSDLEKYQTDSENFESKYKGKLSELAADGANLAQAIIRYEELQDLAGRLMSFASLTQAGDVTDSVKQKFMGDVLERLNLANKHLLFFELEMNLIEDRLLEIAIQNPELNHYKPWIDDIRKERPYQLEERVEQLFHEKSVTSFFNWVHLFDETISSQRFVIDGEVKSIEEALNYLQDPVREKRKNAADALAKSFRENISTMTMITNTLAKDKEISDRWRGFEDVSDSRHLANRVEREVVDSLESVVRESYPRLSHRYFKIKADWLGLDKLAFWDRNAPLPESDSRMIPWTEAKKTVLDAYEKFSPEMSMIAQEFFDKGWIDAPVRDGKRQGAFSHPTVPSAHPYIMLNYLGKPRDVMTLAHELGHGVHQVLAGANGALMAPTPLTLAETASVFGEMLTFNSLLESTENPVAKKLLLASKVEDMLNTVVRQIAFYSFERRIHIERRQGLLTGQRIGEIWMEVQAECLGPSVELSDGYEVFWTYIPHFIHSPFYVYAYAFGECLVNSLYSIYENAEPDFQQKYFELLKAGGTKHHSELLAPFGLDARESTFWEKGVSVIERFIDELEKIEV